jgi:hypothetical protein
MYWGPAGAMVAVAFMWLTPRRRHGIRDARHMLLVDESRVPSTFTGLALAMTFAKPPTPLYRWLHANLGTVLVALV